MGFNNWQKKGPVSEINVTPLVDVMLVLLVIFMITAPLMLSGIKLSLPKTKEVNRLQLNTEQVVLSFTRSLDYYLGEERVLASELLPEITARFAKTKRDTLFLRADFGIKYGEVAKLMSYLKRGGIHKISLITEKIP
jgi:biopolymer transport protein TolR